MITLTLDILFWQKTHFFLFYFMNNESDCNRICKYFDKPVYFYNFSTAFSDFQTKHFHPYLIKIACKMRKYKAFEVSITANINCMNVDFKIVFTNRVGNSADPDRWLSLNRLKNLNQSRYSFTWCSFSCCLFHRCYYFFCINACISLLLICSMEKV